MGRCERWRHLDVASYSLWPFRGPPKDFPAKTVGRASTAPARPSKLWMLCLAGRLRAAGMWFGSILLVSPKLGIKHLGMCMGLIYETIRGMSTEEHPFANYFGVHQVASGLTCYSGYWDSITTLNFPTHGSRIQLYSRIIESMPNLSQP